MLAMGVARPARAAEISPKGVEMGARSPNARQEDSQRRAAGKGPGDAAEGLPSEDPDQLAAEAAEDVQIVGIGPAAKPEQERALLLAMIMTAVLFVFTYYVLRWAGQAGSAAVKGFGGGAREAAPVKWQPFSPPPSQVPSSLRTAPLATPLLPPSPGLRTPTQMPRTHSVPGQLLRTGAAAPAKTAAPLPPGTEGHR